MTLYAHRGRIEQIDTEIALCLCDLNLKSCMRKATLDTEQFSELLNALLSLTLGLIQLFRPGP